MNIENSNFVIEMNQIRKSYGPKLVLRNISGSIEKGKTVGLLGRNGEGKTTLFRILLDIIASDGGSANILGRSPDGSGAIRRTVGYIPERPVFHSFQTIKDVFRLREKLFPTWDRPKASRLANQLDMDLNGKIAGASKGTLAKIAWICATAHNPELLFLDEPTSGLDPLVRDSVLTHFIRELSEERKTILVASHRMEELIHILDEVWVLSGGEISGRHNMEDLRKGAFRITGRLKEQISISGLPVFEEFKNGDFVRWIVMDTNALQQIRSMALLDQIETEPVPMDITLKVLLAQKENFNAATRC